MTGLAVVVAAMAVVVVRIQAARRDAPFEEQMRLARAEGIPTTVAEFKATVPVPPESENAAPYYRKLDPKTHRTKIDHRELARLVVFEPSSENISKARAALSEFRDWLDIADIATSKPHCWFDRDWGLGYAVLLPEYAQGKKLAKALLLRGSIAASEHKPELAVKDAKAVLQIAKHFREEPLQIAEYVARSLEEYVLRQLSYWCYQYRGVALYRSELEAAVNGLPAFDLKKVHRYDLVELLITIKLCETKDGRDKIGLKDSDLPPAASVAILTALQPPDVGRVKIVKALRDQWAAFDKPVQDRSRLIAKAENDLMQGLLSFPTVAKLYDALELSDEKYVTDQDDVTNAKKLLYRAILRATSTSPISKSIKTSDLMSPFDQKPVTYSFDGKTMVIDVSFPANMRKKLTLEIPPPKLKSF